MRSRCLGGVVSRLGRLRTGGRGCGRPVGFTGTVDTRGALDEELHAWEAEKRVGRRPRGRHVERQQGEVLDVTLRSDKLVADLLKFLDAAVGPDRYVLVVTSVHGVCPIPEQERTRREYPAARRVKVPDLLVPLEAALTDVFGPGSDGPVRWLALRPPALYRDAHWRVPKFGLDRADLVSYRSSLVAASGNRALAACEAFKGDALIVESEHDSMVPHTVIESYRAAFGHVRSITYRVLSGADHALSSEQSRHDYGQLLVTWMTEMLLGARAATGRVRPMPKNPA